MRQITMVALSAMLLAGCGTQGMGMGAYGVAQSGLAAQSATAAGSFTEVLNQEWDFEHAVSEKLSAWAQQQHLTMTMAPGNVQRVAQDAYITGMGIRPMANGDREVAGWVIFSNAVPHSYLSWQVGKGFKLVLKASGAIKDVQILSKDLPGVTFDKPQFKAVDGATAKALMGRVSTFLHQPAQSEWITGDLWGAVAGESKSHTFELEDVQATPGAFGRFGRVIRYKGTLKNGDRPVPGYTHVVMEAVMNADGQVTGAGDPSW